MMLTIFFEEEESNDTVVFISVTSGLRGAEFMSAGADVSAGVAVFSAFRLDGCSFSKESSKSSRGAEVSLPGSSLPEKSKRRLF